MRKLAPVPVSLMTAIAEVGFQHGHCRSLAIEEAFRALTARQAQLQERQEFKGMGPGGPIPQEPDGEAQRFLAWRALVELYTEIDVVMGLARDDLEAGGFGVFPATIYSLCGQALTAELRFLHADAWGDFIDTREA